jgi:hypothetical protein
MDKTQTDCTLFVMQEQRLEVRGQRLDVGLGAGCRLSADGTCSIGNQNLSMECGRMTPWNLKFVVAFMVPWIAGFAQSEFYERVEIPG